MAVVVTTESWRAAVHAALADGAAASCLCHGRQRRVNLRQPVVVVAAAAASGAESITAPRSHHFGARPMTG